MDELGGHNRLCLETILGATITRTGKPLLTAVADQHCRHDDVNFETGIDPV